ncbi:MAG: cupin domain-containing protein [Alphaproteobacteria bacterium]|jgi:mannose-6-phosphate isomerase-like protein (cupin superfamily)|nr:cupin domain-containing protein [Alphaproteobacteria bacterium]
MSDVIKMTQDEMNDRVARFADQKGNDQLMITQSIPGFQRDIYSIIGKGVSEDAGTQPGIVDSEGFNVAYVGAAPDNGSAMHTHNEEVEVFIPITGQWAIYWNEDDDMEEVVLGPMDCISVPAKVMRSFKNVGDTYGHLLVIIGGTENTTVSRPQGVIDAAEAAGLVLDKDGKMVAAE